jgi:hypothetical protein
MVSPAVYFSKLSDFLAPLERKLSKAGFFCVFYRCMHSTVTEHSRCLINAMEWGKKERLILRRRRLRG